MKIRESQVEKGICDFAKTIGVTMQKQNGVHNRGKADQLCMRGGKAAFLEIKRPGEKPTKLQERYLRLRREDGFPATWVDNVEDGIAWLKEVFP